MAERSFFQRLKAGLSKTHDKLVNGMESVFMGVSSIDEDFYEELEETLLMGDLGVQTTETLIGRLREEVERRHLMHPGDCRGIIIDVLKEMMALPEDAYAFEEASSVVFVIGVNGVGKTTSIGKLSHLYREEGKKVMIAAADTFRAAAIDQLKEWADRANVPMIAQSEGSDPAAVVFDAVSASVSRGTDILFVDTAGRLHNKKNLMEELRKMDRIITTQAPGRVRENLLVLYSTTGQNALNQAKQFMEVSDITGIVLTKMDGSAKGGVAIAIASELHVPVKFIGVGEGIDDLQKFDPDEFVDALFDTSASEGYD